MVVKTESPECACVSTGKGRVRTLDPGDKYPWGDPPSLQTVAKWPVVNQGLSVLANLWGQPNTSGLLSESIVFS